MSNDVDYWIEIGRLLGIEVVAPAELKFSGVEARFTALLPQFGGTAGMVVDGNWSAIEPYASALMAAGYGYSCVGAGDATDLPTEMLADWGWASSAPKPGWLTP